MIENLNEISVEQLTSEAKKMFDSGYRFVTATTVDNGDETFTITYHFDKDYVLQNYRIKVAHDAEIPSISKVYLCALLVENEIKELFGVKVKDIAIDYGGHLLMSDDEMCSPQRNQITIEQRGGKSNG